MSSEYRLVVCGSNEGVASLEPKRQLINVSPITRCISGVTEPSLHERGRAGRG